MVLRGLKVGVMKPMETGCSLIRAEDGSTINFGGLELSLDETSISALERLEQLAGPPPSTHSVQVPRQFLCPNDAHRLVRASSRDVDLDLVNLYRYAPSLEPGVAAQLLGTSICVEDICARYADLARSSDLMVVEGSHGLMTPLGANTSQLDLISALKLPVVLVAPSTVGTIGRCLLNAEVLRARKVSISGIVLNRAGSGQVQPEEAANPVNIEAHCDAVVRGVLPHFEEKKLDDLDYLARRLEVHVDLDGLLGT